TPERVRGYTPLAMKNVAADTTFNYQATRLNGERFYLGSQVTGRELWIKVEMVSFDDTTQSVVTRDITADFLSLGVTEQAVEIRDSSNAVMFKVTNAGYSDTAPSSSLTATSAQSASTGTDSRSVIKLQRFVIRGPQIPTAGTSYTTYYAPAGTQPFNVVERYSSADAAKLAAGCSSGCTLVDADAGLDTGDSFYERDAHLKLATVNAATNRAVVPFPIKMFDTREGAYFDENSTTYYTSTTNLTRNGLMSVIDIDLANLRRFFRGDFNGLFPTTTPFAALNGGVGLRNADVPQREGWVFYVSDRRGDADFDGEFDMEDIYSAAPGNGGSLEPGEDININGSLQTAYGAETERYNTNTIAPDLGAVQDHKYYRRAVRLINGTTIPGVYDAATPGNTRGFSFASENGVYVQGNYNATGVASVPASANTPYSDYLPFNSATHVPASIVADAVMVLSNSWNDSQSFSAPYSKSSRVASTTHMRFAMIAGDTITSIEASPHQGGTDERLNGGLHNFKRFLEDWGASRLDYTGSLINLYNSHNNNGSFKCCNTVYSPPRRNWVFDATFLDPARLPPGTPFFQYVQTTGFQRTND
ncbi:MAG: hypothetical protein ABL952_16035, partial [Pyrinomonadaceae bacterium]